MPMNLLQCSEVSSCRDSMKLTSVVKTHTFAVKDSLSIRFMLMKSVDLLPWRTLSTKTALNF